MAKNNYQGKQQKSQSAQKATTTIKESTQGKSFGDSREIGKSRKGTAGDSTNSTGPRKKE